MNISGLARIELKSNDPIDLYTEWSSEAKTFTSKAIDVVSLSTVSNGLPRVRHVILRKYDTKGFVFFTDRRGRKSQELSENNYRAAMCIYWTYTNLENERICRQVRIEGVVETLPRAEIVETYNSEPVYAKIRAHLCHQDSVVDWDEMKKRHDELLRQYTAGETILPMPDHYIGYRLIPTWMDFYFAKDNFIGDRMEFNRNEDGSTWILKRLAA